MQSRQPSVTGRAMQQGQRFGTLDSLRFVAAALVLVQHLFEGRTGWMGDNVVPLGPGVAGVALFFFISGYVIPLSVGRGLQPVPFAVRRLFRIYPLYLAALLLLLVLGTSGALPRWADMATASPWRWLANLLLVQDFVRQPAFLGVAWTLIIELLWYALFAAALHRFGARAAEVLDRTAPLLLLLAAAASLLLGVRLPLGRPTMIYAAILGYQCFRHGMGEISGRRLAQSVAIFAAVTLITTAIAFGVFRHPTITLAQAMGPWLLATIVFVGVVTVRPLRELAVLQRGLLPLLGAASYSLYLLHPIAIAAADHYAPAPWRLAAALALTALLAFLGYRGIERPGIAAGRQVARRFAAAAG